MARSSEQVAYLEMLQRVVDRLAVNSSSIKGWAVVLVSGTLALAAGTDKPAFVAIAYLPVLSFWILDAYYLRQERLFRALFNHAATNQTGNTSFSMDTAPVSSSVEPLLVVAKSGTLVGFYGPLLILTVVLSVLLPALT